MGGCLLLGSAGLGKCNLHALSVFTANCTAGDCVNVFISTRRICKPKGGLSEAYRGAHCKIPSVQACVIHRNNYFFLSVQVTFFILVGIVIFLSISYVSLFFFFC